MTLAKYDAELESRMFSGRIPVMRNGTVYPHVRSYLPLLAVSLLAGLLVIAWRGG